MEPPVNYAFSVGADAIATHDRRIRLSARSIRLFFRFGKTRPLSPKASECHSVRLPRESTRLLEKLGIASYAHRKPGELSGGQRHAAAIARAVLHRPRVMLADETTAALDWNSGQVAVSLLVQQAKAEGALLITVTHDTRLIGLFDRIIHLESGKVRAE